MEEKKIPFWEEAYQNLEAGCGEGQNVLYLARQGYSDIDAFDLSENGIAKVSL